VLGWLGDWMALAMAVVTGIERLMELFIIPGHEHFCSLLATRRFSGLC